MSHGDCDWYDDMEAFLLLEEALCDCDALCTCDF